MDRGTWQATVHGVAKEVDMTERLNNNNKNCLQSDICVLLYSLRSSYTYMNFYCLKERMFPQLLHNSVMEQHIFSKWIISGSCFKVKRTASPYPGPQCMTQRMKDHLLVPPAGVSQTVPLKSGSEPSTAVLSHRKGTVLGASVVLQSLSLVWLFVTPLTPARPASLSFTISRSLLKSCPLSQ